MDKRLTLDFDALADAIADRVADRMRDQNSTSQRRLLTVRQAAEYIGRTEPAVRHLVAEGKIRAHKVDRRISIDVRELDRWVDDNKI